MYKNHIYVGSRKPKLVNDFCTEIANRLEQNRAWIMRPICEVVIADVEKWLKAIVFIDLILIQIANKLYKSYYYIWLIGCALRQNNPCRLFTAKSCLCIYVLDIYNL